MAARYSKMGAIPQILFLILLIVGLTVGGLLWFDYLGLIRVQDFFSPILGVVGVDRREPFEDTDDVMLLDRLRLGVLQDALELEFEELADDRAAVERRRLELEQTAQELASSEAELQERVVSLN